VQTLFEYLEGGDILEDFLAGFPTVSRDLAFTGTRRSKATVVGTGPDTVAAR
jgi:hypothetical protein